MTIIQIIFFHSLSDFIWTCTINPSYKYIVSKKQKTIYLSEGNYHYYTIEGNHSVIFSLRTLDDEAIIKITYKNKTKEYTIHNSDISDKLV